MGRRPRGSCAPGGPMSSRHSSWSVVESVGGLVTLLRVVTLSALVTSCSSEEILLITLPEGGVSTTPDRGPSCDDEHGCEPDSFCSRSTCDAKRGSCERRPTFCDGAPAPVCGCDGSTYWNDCLRKVRGQRSSTPGECPVGRATSCSERGRPCAPGSVCARIAPMCAPDLAGTCWVVPAACPPSSGIDRFVKCAPPGPTPPCVDLCEAIRSGVPHARADSCP